MDGTSPIVRVPIKLRKPILKEYCGCWNTKVFAVRGVPHYILGDNLSIEELTTMLDSLEQSVGFHFSEHIDVCRDKVMEVLNRKLPVTIKTNCVLPLDVIEALRSVPHSAIHISMNFLDNSIRNRLEPSASDIFSLREMMFLAKSYKIFVVVHMDYQPHLVSRLDLFEIVDMVKNQIAHLIVRFPRVRDEDFYTNRTKWESLSSSSLNTFKQYYVADVPTRTWNIREKYRKSFLNELQTYVKSKKINIEIDSSWESSNRVRHEHSGLSDLPTGMRPFFYDKIDGVFVSRSEAPDQVCEKCNKQIL